MCEHWIALESDTPLGFSHGGKMLASGSENKFLDVADVESGEQLCSIPTRSSNAMEWHPGALLAFADENANGIHVATVGTLAH